MNLMYRWILKSIPLENGRIKISQYLFSIFKEDLKLPAVNGSNVDGVEPMIEI